MAMASDPPIPFIYRLIFHYIEPLAAFSGGCQALFFPSSLFDIQTPNAAPHYSASSAPLRPLSIQIAGGWLLLAWIDSFMLRYTNDRKIWRIVMAGGFISDACYITSIWWDLGNATFFDPRLWDANAAGTIVSTIIPLVMKLTFILGIGTGEKSKSKSNSKAE